MGKKKDVIVKESLSELKALQKGLSKLSYWTTELFTTPTD
jgi:hypothetical protein